MRQNITLSIEKEILKKAKILAAKRETSISKLLAEQLSRAIADEDQYEVAKKRATARLRKGFPLGGRILAKREELHARR
jgi:hypothetical protein